MNELISVIIFILVIVIGVIVTVKISPEPKKQTSEKNQNDIRINGVVINLSDEEKRKAERQKQQKEQQQFNQVKEYLFSVIYEDWDKTEDIIRKKVLENLLERKIETIDDLAKLDFLYNDGKLRTNEEADYIERFFKYQKERENFDQHCHKVNVYSFLIPFFCVFIITCLFAQDIIFGPLLGLTFGLFASLIGAYIGHDSNIQDAEEYCVPNDNPRLRNEILNKKAAIMAIISSSVVTGHHIKKAIKDIANVDGWKEMK